MDMNRSAEYKDRTDANTVEDPKDPPLLIWLGIGCAGFIGLVTMIPFLYDLLISFRQYDFLKGILGSSFAGLSQYTEFILSVDFARLIWNTVRNGFFYGIFLLIFTIIGGGIVGALPFRGIARNAIATFFLIPVFIPDAIFVSWFARFQGEFRPLIDASVIWWFLPALRALKYTGIPIFAASVIGERRKSKTLVLPVQAGVCFVLLSFMFTLGNDFIFSWLVANPLNYVVVDSLELYAFRIGFMQMDISRAAVVLVVRQIGSLIAMGIFFVPFCFIGKRLFAMPQEQESMEEPDLKKRMISGGAAFLLWIVIVGVFMVTKGMKPWGETGAMLTQSLQLVPALLLYTCLALAAAGIQVILSALLGYPAVCGTHGTRKIGMIFILLLSALGSLPFTIGQYIMIRNMGMGNTYFAVLTGWIFPTAGVWTILAICHMQKVRDGKSYRKAIAFPMVGLLFVQIISNLNNMIPSLLYIPDQRRMSPLLTYWQRVMTSGEMAGQYTLFDGAIFWYSMILSVIPVGICLGMRIFCSDRTMFSIFGMRVKG